MQIFENTYIFSYENALTQIFANMLYTYGITIEQCRQTKSVYAIICVNVIRQRAFVLHKISEIARCHFHIKEKRFTHNLSYAAYYNH